MGFSILWLFLVMLCVYVHNYVHTFICAHKEPRVSKSGVSWSISLQLIFWNEIFHSTWGINNHSNIYLSLGLGWQTCAISHGSCGCCHLNAGPLIWTASPSTTKTISHVPSCSILSGVLLLVWNDWIWYIKWGLTPYSKSDRRFRTTSQFCSLKRSPPRLTE